MKTESLLIAISVAILSISVARAQKVEAALYEGHPVINCEGMPLLSYDTNTKGQSAVALLISDEANKKLFKRFAVSKSDNHAGQPVASAFTTCKNLGSGWRLPTQRELMLIWVLKTKLESKSGFKPFYMNGYWSATEYSPDYSFWTVDFSTSATAYGFKNDGYIVVRCIRELE